MSKMGKKTQGSILSGLPGGRVLDAATGAGNFAVEMEMNFSDCTLIAAIDTSIRPLVNIAKRHGSSKIAPSAMDAALLAFRDETFNTVALSNSLHHLNNPGEILSEMMRTLTPGGFFVIREMFSDGDQTLSQKTHTILHNWWAATDSNNGVVHNPVFTEQEIYSCIESIGLVNLRFQISEDLTGNPYDSEVMSHLNKALEVYDKRASAFYSLREQGKEAKAYLKKHGFTGARALITVGMKPE